MNKALEAIHKRRGFFIGDSKKPFTSLVAFISGYQCGFNAKAHGFETPENLLPNDFNQFVTEKYTGTKGLGPRGWQGFIEDNSASEEEAFNLFFELRKEYDTKFQSK